MAIYIFTAALTLGMLSGLFFFGLFLFKRNGKVREKIEKQYFEHFRKDRN